MTTSEDTSVFPPLRDATCPFDPPPELMRLQSECPVSRVSTWDGTEAWMFTRYAEARDILNDERFSADPRRPGFPEKSAAYRATLGSDDNLRTLDNPEHDRQKRMLIRDFTVRRVDAMRPSIQAKVDALIDSMLEGSEADLVRDLALPVPTMVICELLGVPYEYRDWFAELSIVMLSSTASPEEASRAGQDMVGYLDRLIDEKLAAPGDDLTSRIATEQVATGELSREQATSTLRLMLIAGHETTANMIALGSLALLQHPDQKQILVEDQDPAVVSNAVEELLRYLSNVHTGRRRVAVEDVEIAGQVVRAGEGVIVMNNVADRDESEFPHAAELDLRRPNARGHLAFGYGIHQCLGQLLARVELQIVMQTVWRRIPTLRLAVPFEEVEFAEHGQVYGIHSLPVTWDR